VRRGGGHFRDAEDFDASRGRARRRGQGRRVDIAVHGGTLHSRARRVLMLASAPRVLRGGRRVHRFQASRALRLLRRHPRGAHKPGPDGPLEVEAPRRKQVEQTRTAHADDGVDTARHAGSDATRPAGWRRLGGLSHVPTGLRPRRRSMPVRHRRDVPARDVPRVRGAHLRRAVERGYTAEAQRRVETSAARKSPLSDDFFRTQRPRARL